MVVVSATVNGRPLLATPSTVTTTFPLVAPTGTGTTMAVLDQLIGVAVVPLNLTVLDPRLSPKFVPVSVTVRPTGAKAGDRLVNVGADRASNITSLEYGLISPRVLYAWTAKKYRPGANVNGTLMTFPTSSVVV